MDTLFGITEEEFDKICSTMFKQGCVHGILEASRDLSERAGAHFRNGNDNLARETRDLSQYLENQHNKKRLEIEGLFQEYNEIKDAIFNRVIDDK